MMCPLLTCFDPTETPGFPPAAGPVSTGHGGRRREAGRNATVNP